MGEQNGAGRRDCDAPGCGLPEPCERCRTTRLARGQVARPVLRASPRLGPVPVPASLRLREVAPGSWAIAVLGSPSSLPFALAEDHSCDAMGCGSAGDHILFTFRAEVSRG